jgi:hypothetical protein
MIVPPPAGPRRLLADPWLRAGAAAGAGWLAGYAAATGVVVYEESSQKGLA